MRFNRRNRSRIKVHYKKCIARRMYGLMGVWLDGWIAMTDGWMNGFTHNQSHARPDSCTTRLTYDQTHARPDSSTTRLKHYQTHMATHTRPGSRKTHMQYLFQQIISACTYVSISSFIDKRTLSWLVQLHEYFVSHPRASINAAILLCMGF